MDPVTKSGVESKNGMSPFKPFFSKPVYFNCMIQIVDLNIHKTMTLRVKRTYILINDMLK